MQYSAEALRCGTPLQYSAATLRCSTPLQYSSVATPNQVKRDLIPRTAPSTPRVPCPVPLPSAVRRVVCVIRPAPSVPRHSCHPSCAASSASFVSSATHLAPNSRRSYPASCALRPALRAPCSASRAPCSASRAAPRVLRSAPRTLRPFAPCPAPLVPRTLFSSPRAYAFARCAPRLAEIAVSLSKISFFRNPSKKDYILRPLRRRTIFFRKKSRKR